MEKSNESSIKLQLISDIESAKSDMKVAEKNFNCVISQDDIDMYIYRLSAAQARYDGLLKKLKSIS